MSNQFLIKNLTVPIKYFIGAFLILLSIGYFTGLAFVAQTDSTTPQGIEENYNGNEDEDAPKVLKFKKSSREMLTIIHTHVLSISMIFFMTGILLWCTEQRVLIKKILSIEPFVSVLVTFGGIYLVWLGYSFFSILIVISGTLMTLSYVLAILFIFNDLLKKPSP
ncbi:MAG: hypothetical protein ISP64_07035 [Flavobacteriaceae bacterium]|jgi:hypothetical protein|nr:hypothetical protein [Flavobacteriaceae bacterium]